MDESVELFEGHRRQLLRLAYSMLGTLSGAKDIVQEAFLRWQKADLNEIDSAPAYLSTIVTRLCLDELKSARHRREQYIGPWLPEPVATSGVPQPDQSSELAERLSIALLHTLEQLNPVQRAVFLLHDVFDYSFKEIADILGRKPAACRKTAQRARQYLQDKQPVPAPPSQAQNEKLNTFLEALQTGDVDEIRELLAKDATMYSDGGGKVTAARKPIYGSDRISRFLAGLMRQAPSDTEIHTTFINDRPGFVILIDNQLHSAWTFQVSSDSIDSVFVVLNPDKLETLKGQLSQKIFNSNNQNE